MTFSTGWFTEITIDNTRK